MKIFIGILLIVLLASSVIAIDNSKVVAKQNKRVPYYNATKPVTPIVQNPMPDVPVNTVVTPPNVNITVVPGGQVIDLSKTPPTTPLVKVEPTLPNTASPIPAVPKVSTPIKHSFWYWLWPPHWFTKNK